MRYKVTRAERCEGDVHGQRAMKRLGEGTNSGLNVYGMTKNTLGAKQ